MSYGPGSSCVTGRPSACVSWMSKSGPTRPFRTGLAAGALPATSRAAAAARTRRPPRRITLTVRVATAIGFGAPKTKRRAEARFRSALSGAQLGAEPVGEGADDPVADRGRVLVREGALGRLELGTERERLLPGGDLVAAIHVERPQLPELRP